MTNESLNKDDESNIAKPELGVVDLCDDCALLNNCSNRIKHSDIQHLKIWCWRTEETKDMTNEQYLQYIRQNNA